MKKWQLVEIVWCDSDHGSGWLMTAELNAQTERNMLCRSIGFYFREVGESVQIVQSYAATDTHEEQVNGILTIPKVAIKRKRCLK